MGKVFKEIPELFEAVHLAAAPYSKEPFQLDNTDVKPPWFEELIGRRLLIPIWVKDTKFWVYEFRVSTEESPFILKSGDWIVKARIRRGVDREFKVFENDVFLQKFEGVEES